MALLMALSASSLIFIHCNITSETHNTNYMILGLRCYGQKAKCKVKKSEQKVRKIDERQLRTGYDNHERRKDIPFEHAKGRKL